MSRWSSAWRAQYLLATVVLSGILMVLFGVLRLGKLIRMVPHPVMLGFVNGLAIVIATAQLAHFREATSNGTEWLHGSALAMMCGLVVPTMVIVYVLPRLTRAALQGLVECYRKAVVADRYVRRHPWNSVLVAATAGLAAATYAKHNGHEDAPHNSN